MAIDLTNAAYLLWQGKDSRDYYFALSAHPEIVPALPTYDWQATIGDFRTLSKGSPTYSMIEVRAEMIYIGGRITQTDSSFRTYLNNFLNSMPYGWHKNKLVFSEDLTKYYEAEISDVEVDNNAESDYVRRITVTWLAQPYVKKYYPLSSKTASDDWQNPYVYGKEHTAEGSGTVTSDTIAFASTPTSTEIRDFDFGTLIRLSPAVLSDYETKGNENATLSIGCQSRVAYSSYDDFATSQEAYKLNDPRYCMQYRCAFKPWEVWEAFSAKFEKATSLTLWINWVDCSMYAVAAENDETDVTKWVSSLNKIMDLSGFLVPTAKHYYSSVYSSGTTTFNYTETSSASLWQMTTSNGRYQVFYRYSDYATDSFIGYFYSWYCPKGVL